MPLNDLSIYGLFEISRAAVQTTLRQYCGKPSGFNDKMMDTAKFKEITDKVSEAILASLEKLEDTGTGFVKS